MSRDAAAILHIPVPSVVVRIPFATFSSISRERPSSLGRGRKICGDGIRQFSRSLSAQRCSRRTRGRKNRSGYRLHSVESGAVHSLQGFSANPEKLLFQGFLSLEVLTDEPRKHARPGRGSDVSFVFTGCKKRLAIGLAYFAGATLFALFTFSVYTTSALADREQINYRKTMLYELTGGYSVMLLSPLVLRFMKRYPIRAQNWTRRVPLHLVVSIAFGASLTLMMWGSRTIMFRVLGWGPFNYGHMGYRFIMEYEKQFAIYWGIYGIASLVAYARESRERFGFRRRKTTSSSTPQREPT